MIPADSFEALHVQTFFPEPHLKPWIQCYWVLGGEGGVGTAAREKLYPDAGSSLTIDLSTDQPAISFTSNRVTRVEVFRSNQQLISIRFNPSGSLYLLDLDPQMFGDQQYVLGGDLEPAWYRSFMALMDRIHPLTMSGRVAGIQGWLTHRLQKLDALERDMRTIQGIVAQTKLMNSVPLLCERLGMNRRTLERKLRREVGVSPAELIQFGRMYRARYGLIHTPASIGDVALDCGFFDQAHFSHAFRRYTLETPGSYRKRKVSQIYNK